MSKRIVCKFGGSSMADAASISKSSEVAVLNKASIVVVSAVSGVTDNLIRLTELVHTTPWPEISAELAELQNRHERIAEELNADEEILSDIVSDFKNLEALLKASFVLGSSDAQLYDAIVAHGEILSSRLMLAALSRETGGSAIWLSAKDIIVTDDLYTRASPQTDAIKQKATKLLVPGLKDRIFVTQGFIGATENGKTTTLGRGGSDYSAALFAEAISADLVQIWTDVSGVASIDPRLSDASKPISKISYQETSELATAGAKILHPPTMIPARRSRIPIFVGNTFNPKDKGTLITGNVKELPLVRAVALKQDQVLLTLSTPKMTEEYGFLADVFEIFSRHKISVDQVTTSEASIAITIDKRFYKNTVFLKSLEALIDTEVESGLSVVTIIGNRVNHTPGIFSKITQALSGEGSDVNIRAVFQGASRHSIGILVEDSVGRVVARKLHKAFIESGE